MANDRTELLASLGAFRTQWVSLGWSWDRRFECVASTFAYALADEARQAVSTAFPLVWKTATLKDAPALVTEIATATGGVRSDQVLYSTPEVDRIVAYGLWWPWGSGGTNISMRVGLTGPAAHSAMNELREVFGALD